MRWPVWAHGLVWLCFALVALAPPIWLTVDAVREWGGGLSWPPLTPDQWALLVRSLALAATAAGIAMALGAPYALLCERTDLPGAPFWRAAGLLPLLIPPFIHAMAWQQLSNEFQAGTAWLEKAAGTALPSVPPVFAVAIVLALAYLPFVFLLTTAGLRSVDERAEEAGLLRAGPLLVWGRMTLPLARPHLLAGGLFVFVFALVEFAVPDILRVQVYPVEIFIQFSALYDEAAALALAVPLLATAVAAVLLIGWTMRGRRFVSVSAGQGGAPRVALGRWRPFALAFCLGVLLLSVVVPFVHLLVTAGPPSSYLRAVAASGDDLFASLALSFVAAVLTVVLGTFVALSLHALGGCLHTGLNLLSQVPFAVPPILLGIGLIKVWNHPDTAWLYGSAAILLLGYMAHFVPFAVRTLHAAIAQVEPRQIEAGILSAERPLVLVRILLPLIRNGLLAAVFICFVLSLGELGVTLLVTPPGLSPIPIDIYNYLHYGAEERVAALCLILIAAQLTIAVVLYGLRARSGGS